MAACKLTVATWACQGQHHLQASDTCLRCRLHSAKSAEWPKNKLCMTPHLGTSYGDGPDHACNGWSVICMLCCETSTWKRQLLSFPGLHFPVWGLEGSQAAVLGARVTRTAAPGDKRPHAARQRSEQQWSPVQPSRWAPPTRLWCQPPRRGFAGRGRSQLRPCSTTGVPFEHHDPETAGRRTAGA